SINPTRRSFCNLNGCRNGGQGCVEKSAYWEIGTIQCTKPTKLAIRILATGERGEPAENNSLSNSSLRSWREKSAGSNVGLFKVSSRRVHKRRAHRRGGLPALRRVFSE